MFMKLMLEIVEVRSNDLVWINWVAALKWSNTIYPNLGYTQKKTLKIDIFDKGVLKVL